MLNLFLEYWYKNQKISIKNRKEGSYDCFILGFEMVEEAEVSRLLRCTRPVELTQDSSEDDITDDARDEGKNIWFLSGLYFLSGSPGRLDFWYLVKVPCNFLLQKSKLSEILPKIWSDFQLFGNHNELQKLYQPVQT